ncbi:hypothetical protein FACS1894211_11880 [Clostridia bacterium]|nr:hypothetical protein FACS1894211_11880 [Clostridia bacterium]
MATESVRCTNCGYEGGNFKFDGKFGRCPACRGMFTLKQAETFAKVDVDRAKDIQNLRKLLAAAVKKDDVLGIDSHAGKIKELLPEDYTAGYYYAYARKRRGQPAYMADFLKTDGKDIAPAEKEAILEHLIRASDLRDKYEVNDYIDGLDGINRAVYIKQNDAAYAEKKRTEENYEDVPRDVFVCHRSKNAAIAEAAVKALERDGNACWISTRNLRPNDEKNYWDSIRKAIVNCKLFLVISGEAAMVSADCKEEINIARELNKPRLEYKIDTSAHTPLFKSFFDGVQWIEAWDDPSASLHKLSKRVFLELDNLRNGKKANETDKLDELKDLIRSQTASVPTAAVGHGGGASIASLLKKARIELGDGDYKKAEQTCERIAEIDPENGELWECRWLIENEASDLDALSRRVKELSQSRNYQKVLRFGSAAVKERCTAAADKAKKNLAAKQERERIKAAEEAERQRIADAEEAERRRVEEAKEAKRRAEEAERRRVADAEAEKRRAKEAERQRIADAEAEKRRRVEEAEEAKRKRRRTRRYCIVPVVALAGEVLAYILGNFTFLVVFGVIAVYGGNLTNIIVVGVMQKKRGDRKAAMWLSIGLGVAALFLFALLIRILPSQM